MREKNFDVGTARTGLRRNQNKLRVTRQGGRKILLPKSARGRSLLLERSPRAPRNLWFSSPQEKQWAWEALLVQRGVQILNGPPTEEAGGDSVQSGRRNADPGRARGARAAACKSRDATTFGQSDCYKVWSLLRRDRPIKGPERTSAPAELAG